MLIHIIIYYNICYNILFLIIITFIISECDQKNNSIYNNIGFRPQFVMGANINVNSMNSRIP